MRGARRCRDADAIIQQYITYWGQRRKMLVAEPVQSLIWSCLNHYAFEDAVFLAERHHADAPTEDTLFLLATAYYRSGSKLQCEDLLTGWIGGLPAKCKFLLAKVAFDLNRLPTAEAAATTPSSDPTTEPFRLKLQASICKSTDRVETARDCLERSLKLNPFLFTSFLEYCELGECGLGGGVFELTPESTPSTFPPESTAKSTPLTPLQQKPQKAIPLSEELSILNPSNKSTLPRKFRGNLFTSTPMSGGMSFGGMLAQSEESGEVSYTEEQQKKKQTAQTQSPAVRRSSRLFSSSAASVKENSKTPQPPAILRGLSSSPSRRAKKKIQLENMRNSAGVESPQQKQGYLSQAEHLLATIRQIAQAYTLLTKFDCRAAIHEFNKLPREQRESGFVLGLIAKCFFELGEYEECIGHYSLIRTREPHRLANLDYLSTAYWHTQNEVALSALSQQLMQTNRGHANTWIATGNCFSLHKEHETAIKFFKRSIQINPGNAYAYTLLGHEYVAIDEYEKGMRCFRNAVRVNPRLYNAWYGVGMIFYKQERYSRAEVYYRKALEICPGNSVLMCHLGVVQHSLSRTPSALATFNAALAANPKDPLCKFHRASVLFSTGKLAEALAELEELKQIVPKESLVYFLMAKVFSKQGDTHKALLHFSWATDLDPKGQNNQIKESIEPVLSRGPAAAVEAE